MQERNFVFIRGTVVGMHVTTRSISFRIATDSGVKDTIFPSVIFDDAKLTKDIKMKDRVCIEAHIRTRPIRQDDGKRIFISEFIGDKIEPATRILADLVDGLDEKDGGYPEDENEVILAGTVTHVFNPNSGLSMVSVNIPDTKSGQSNYASVTCFRRQANVAKDLKEGDKVAVAGVIRPTERRDPRGEIMFNVVAKDIARVEG